MESKGISGRYFVYDLLRMHRYIAADFKEVHTVAAHSSAQCLQ